MSQPQDLLSILKALHRDKLTLRERHVAVARHVDHYDFNNTYQYAIAREDVHLSWLERAIHELGGTPDEVPVPTIAAPGRKGSFTPLVAQDASDAQALVAAWRPRIGTITNTRHAKMVGVILGETLEHQRFFAQIAEGNEAVLGTRLPGAGTGHGVMTDRWVE
jgi:Mn-containing catalase